jgi:hypothetical protein
VLGAKIDSNSPGIEDHLVRKGPRPESGVGSSSSEHGEASFPAALLG